MKKLLERKEVKTSTTIVSQEALNEIAMELIKENHKTMNWIIERSIGQADEIEIELLVGDGYVVTIRNSRRG
jgi:hypothetical protein